MCNLKDGNMSPDNLYDWILWHKRQIIELSRELLLVSGVVFDQSRQEYVHPSRPLTIEEEAAIRNLHRVS